jgi:NAD(P)-dependent dehydrogenase (short-subunit alcohol dehydrogenase family)
MDRMTVSFITGANKGLGYETARQLVRTGHTVYIGARDTGRGQAAASELGASFVQLDVTDQASVDAAAAAVGEAERRLDVLVNNAGISGSYAPAPQIDTAEMERVFGTNVFGIVRVTRAFLPLLEASQNPVIVNVGSALGSEGIVTDPAKIESRLPALAYASSKAAVIMLTVQYAKALPGIKVNVVEPGFTATDLNGNRGHQSVAEGAQIIVRMATIGADGPTGTFTDRNGTMPWLQGKLAANEPAGLAAAPPGGLADAAESVRLEQRDGTHVTTGLVDALAARFDRIAFQRSSAHRLRVPDRALQQIVHQAAAPEPWPHHKAHHRPRTLVPDVRDRPGVDQGPVTGLRRDRAPAGRRAIDVRQHPWARFAGAQRLHMRDTARHVEAGIAVHHADASARARLARHHERREVVPPPGRRQHLDPHAPRIGGERRPVPVAPAAVFS